MKPCVSNKFFTLLGKNTESLKPHIRDGSQFALAGADLFIFKIDLKKNVIQSIYNSFFVKNLVISLILSML